ncbi:hypothetical protein LTR95_002177 [Oleoguttula sp. CCFEE 5521]
MEWLRTQLLFMRDHGMKAILIGHSPPARTDAKTPRDETCWQEYTLWMQQYRDVLSGRVEIITGSGGGFGKGIAETFLNQGAKVIIADFVEDLGQKTASELKCEFIKADVTKKADWEKI